MKVTVKTVGGLIKEFLDVDNKISINEFSKFVMEQLNLTDKYESIKLISKGEIMKPDDTLEKFNGVDPVFVCAPKIKTKLAPKPVDESKSTQPQPAISTVPTVPTVPSQQIQNADMSKSYNVRQVHMTVCMFLEFIASHPQLSEMQKQNPSLLINIATNPKMIQLIQQLADQSTEVIEAHDSGKPAPAIKITGFNLTNDGPVKPTIDEDGAYDDLDYNEEAIPEDLLEKMTQLLHSGMLGGMLPGASNIGDVSLTLTDDDKKNIDSLVEMTGVTKGKATQAYLACDKNLNDAANFLFQE
jgi:hypothetical protein